MQDARLQRNHEAELDWKRNALYLLLFVFLYGALGCSLTLDLSAVAQASSHKSIAYALEAVPVLIAFSGLFLSLLFLFAARAAPPPAQLGSHYRAAGKIQRLQPESAD